MCSQYFYSAVMANSKLDYCVVCIWEISSWKWMTRWASDRSTSAQDEDPYLILSHLFSICPWANSGRYPLSLKKPCAAMHQRRRTEWHRELTTKSLRSSIGTAQLADGKLRLKKEWQLHDSCNHYHCLAITTVKRFYKHETKLLSIWSDSCVNSHIFITLGYMTNQQNGQLPVGLLAQ